MESSEDDAGTATSASRRASAREKDVDQAEDVDPSSNYQQDTSEARTCCDTPAMSEDNFDGDSVPSPSSQDVNTSTEAILDMIDEFVDGPGAPKRIPFSLEIVTPIESTSSHDTCEPELHESVVQEVVEPEQSSSTECVQEENYIERTSLMSTECSSQVSAECSSQVSAECSSQVSIECSSQEVSIECSSKVSTECLVQESTECMSQVSTECTSQVSTECTSQTSDSICVNTGTSDNLPQTDSIEVNDNNTIQQCENSESVLVQSVSSSPSSSVQNVCNTSDCERTVKLVSSSDLKDSVTVERAESTSSECSVELSTRIPLRRRLVRPAVSDRRPDSTVSSTVDSQTPNNNNINTSLQPSDTVTKDVSSSSDALPRAEEIRPTKPEEISNVSEINICKAETSTTPSKKIRLIRPKITPTHVTKPDIESGGPDKDQCQSTSSDDVSVSQDALSCSDSTQVPVSERTVPAIAKNSKSQIEERIPKSPSENVVQISSPNETPISNEVIANDCTGQDPLSDVPESHKVEQTCSEVKQTCPQVEEPCPKVEQPCPEIEPLPEVEKLCPEVKEPCPRITEPCPQVEVPEPESVSDIKLDGNMCKNVEETPVENEIEEKVENRINEEKVEEKQIETRIIEVEDEDKQIENEVIDRKVPPIKFNLLKQSDPEIKEAEASKEIDTLKSSNIIETIKATTEPGTTQPIIENTEQSIPQIAEIPNEQKKVPPIKLNLSTSESKNTETQSTSKSSPIEEVSEYTKQVPKLTIKLGNKQQEEVKSPVPKLTIKPIRPPTEDNAEDNVNPTPQIPTVTKLNIKPIIKPPSEKVNDLQVSSNNDGKSEMSDQIPSVTKLNIKPILKPPEKINDIHRKSSSSEISESECSENDESTSTSDQASASDQGSSETVPKVTIKLGRPGTESEGKFYTEQNIPKLTIKNIQQNEKDDPESKLKLVISQSEEKIPKLTIKTVTKSENQPLSPKLTIKPIKPPESASKDNEIPKLKISTESYSPSSEKDNLHVPKITIKPVTKTDAETVSKSKKSTVMCDSSEHIPLVTKLNIKPILKPEERETTEDLEEKVPVVSKLNIKPIVKPKDNEVDSSIEDVPKIIKLNIKPLKSPEDNSSEEKDCDDMNAEKDNSSIPVVTKLNIKPIVKPVDDSMKEENQSSETGNSSDDNTDQIPVVTKINIKPIVKPTEETPGSEQNIPVVTKLNIKPLIKPEDAISPSSPKKESSKNIPVVTKINIKPIVKPDESNDGKIQNEISEKAVKNPPLVMKINMKNMNENVDHDHVFNNIEGAHSPKLSQSPKLDKHVMQSVSAKPVIVNNIDNSTGSAPDSPSVISSLLENSCEVNSVPEHISSVSYEKLQEDYSKRKDVSKLESETDSIKNQQNAVQINEIHETKSSDLSNVKVSSEIKQASVKQKKSLQNCTLLKKLLSATTKDDIERSQEVSNNLLMQCERTEVAVTNCNTTGKSQNHENDVNDTENVKNFIPEIQDYSKHRPIQDVCKESNESVTRPLEISVTDKISNQSSGQDSPRIILKINKTDHGPSAKIITEETHKTTISPLQNDNTNDPVHDKQSPRKQALNSRRKITPEETAGLSIGKRLRSSRIVENAEKTPVLKRNAGKRPSLSESPSRPPNNESEMSVLDSKRLKLEQILSANKTLSISPVVKLPLISPTKTSPEIKQGGKTVNELIVNNENCPKNGNSKLHNILTNLQAKQMQSLQLNDANISNKAIITSEVESNTSTGSSDVVVEITRIANCHSEVQEMMIGDSEFRDLTTPEETSHDPLDTSKNAKEEVAEVKPVESTPQPRKRGRPRKLPVSESAKESTPVVTALEERPQRSLRLTRERPAILTKPRGRGRGRGRRVDTSAVNTSPPQQSPPIETVIVIETLEENESRATSPPIDPTSSRIKLPRMTEALDKSTSTYSTPLSTRRRSSATDLKLFNETSSDSPVKGDEYMKSPEAIGSRGRGWRGRGGPRGRTPRNRGRGRGGGRGATYMKETMGIYGRVCGPATTTVELFEEETCMMDDNATPSKPSHLLDEDSQSSVKSSTNDSSNKMKKSKFADIFDSNKVWTAADVKEYTWPLPDSSNSDNQVMMIQEQVAMFLGVKSFKRRYPELKRRAIVGEEKDYVLTRGVVTEALCDLGITAVDASEVLDIMLSDYPHKYEEYRSYQRQRQLTETSEDVLDSKPDEKPSKVDVKSEKTSEKPEPPKVDPEKLRQEMALAAIASASEWNARANAWRRPACVDLQSFTIHRRRPDLGRPAPTHVRPPAGFYPHALLPGQFQHHYRTYTPEQLRYFPLNTVLAAPPAPPSPIPSSSESEGSWGDNSSNSDDSDGPHHHNAKRKKLTKVKRSSQQEKECDKDKEDSRGGGGGGGGGEEVDTCRVCKLRLEANRKYTHERFLVCANCNAKLHPGCVDLNADTIRKCREYPWQCAECKTCCTCQKPQDDDKMLFCDLCDRGFHIYCVGLDQVPAGRWHCVECSICKSCGARSPSGGGAGAAGGGAGSVAGGDAHWHHQTKRGPGGHKVYSHSLCTPCARAYRIGRYCPLCERSFIGPKGTMQLVICKLCDRQLHQECVRPTVSTLNVLDYTCGECRRGGITSRAAAVRLAPRTIATLFMAKRRFNKYAHRQYMQSRRAKAEAEAEVDAEAEADANSDDPDSDPLRPEFGD